MASPLATSFAVCFAFTENPILRGADMPVCSMQMVSTKSYGAAAICRPDMPHTLRSPPGGFFAATAPPFMATQGLAYATGTRALPPRDPGFPSFRAKRRKTRKATAINRISQITSIKAFQILRHKPSMRHFLCPKTANETALVRREPRRSFSRRACGAASTGLFPDSAGKTSPGRTTPRRHRGKA